ncbi:UNVERIFIED_CONTAM: hypothetical protein K2H54_024845 [Gekko kuhli]
MLPTTSFEMWLQQFHCFGLRVENVENRGESLSHPWLTGKLNHCRPVAKFPSGGKPLQPVVGQLLMDPSSFFTVSRPFLPWFSPYFTWLLFCSCRSHDNAPSFFCVVKREPSSFSAENLVGSNPLKCRQLQQNVPQIPVEKDTAQVAHQTDLKDPNRRKVGEEQTCHTGRSQDV